MKKGNIMRYFKTMVFAFICLFAVGVMNVNAETVKSVGTPDELYNALIDPSIEVVQLANDITATNYLQISTYSSRSTTRTLDLNGNTLDLGSGYDITLKNASAAEANFIIKDSGTTGKIVQTANNNRPMFYLENYTESSKKINLTIEGGKYEANRSGNNGGLIYGNNEYGENNVIIKNATVDGYVLFRGTLNKISIENLTLANTYTSHAYENTDAKLYEDSTKTYADILGENYEAVIKNPDNSEIAIPTSTELGKRITEISSSANINGAIVIREKDGLKVNNIELSETFGYEAPTAKEITIKNTGKTALQIKNVSVNGTDFQIDDGTQTTLNSGDSDTTWKIKAKDGLNAGTYTATITVTDMSGNKYTATVTLVVEKKEITPSIDLVSSWEYGEVVTPIINGVEMLNESEYSVTYTLKNNTNWNKEMPKKVGSYIAKLTINSNNYYASESTVDFEIKKTTKVLKIVANSSDHVYDGNEYTDSGYKVYFDGVEVTDRNETGHILPTGDILKPIEIIGSVTYVSDNYENNNKIKDLSSLDNYNYYENIEMVNGTIKILKNGTPVVIKPIDVEKDFDGNNSTPSKLVATGLVSGDEVGGTIKNIGIYAGEYESEVGSWWITRTVDGREFSVTDCYSNVTTAKGSVKVHPATREFTINDINVLVGEHLNYLDLKAKLNLSVYTRKNPTFRKISGEGTYDLTNGFDAPSSEGVTVMEVTLLEEDTGGDDTPEYKEVTKQFKIIASEKESLTISGLTDNQEFTYDGNEKSPAGTITVEGNKVLVSDLEVSYNGVGYNSTTAPKNAGTYTVTYKIPDSNTNYIGSVTYTFTIKKVKLEKVVLDKTNYEYTGSEIAAEESNFDIDKMNYSGDIKATNVGNYSITVSLNDKDNYEWIDGTNTDIVLNWSIDKATPSYVVPTNLIGVKGDFLRNITLPSGFTWNNPNELLNAGTHTYKATYTPSDTTNYKVIDDIDITVLVKNKYILSGIVSGGHGTINTPSLEVLEGEKVEVVFTPETGYMIDKVLVEGTEVEVTNNKLELTMDGHKLVSVSYKKIPFTINVKDVEGATITPNGAVIVNYGDNKEFTITINNGYKLIKVLVNNVDKTADMVDDKLTLTNITENMELEVVVEKIVYEVTDGANQKYIIDKSEELKFVIDADYINFNSNSNLYVDDVLVDRENYTSSEENGTVIILKKEFVDSLSIGEHTFKAVFSDNGEAITKFYVVNEEVVKPPQTGDNIIIYFVTSILSVIGLAGALVFAHRRKQTN